MKHDLQMVDYWSAQMDRFPLHSMQRRRARELSYEYAYACGLLGGEYVRAYLHAA